MIARILAAFGLRPPPETGETASSPRGPVPGGRPASPRPQGGAGHPNLRLVDCGLLGEVQADVFELTTEADALGLDLPWMKRVHAAIAGAGAYIDELESENERLRAQIGGRVASVTHLRPHGGAS